MKRILLGLICAAALLPACKKDGPSTPKQFLLSKVIYDGKPESEFKYNSGGQLLEEKYYHEENGTWQVTSRSIYSYDVNGHPKEELSYNMPENTPSGKYIFTVNAQGKILRNSIWDISGGEPGTLSFHIDHEYDGNGRLIKRVWKNEDEEVETSVVLNMYPNGNLRTSETFYHYGATEKVWASSYGPGDTTLPASFYNIKAYPINYYYPHLLGQTTRHFTYEDGDIETETRIEYTDRVYNNKGLVTQQKVVTKKIKPAGPDEVHTMKFEYVQF